MSRLFFGGRCSARRTASSRGRQANRSSTCRRHVQQVKAPTADAARVLRGKPLRPDEDRRQVIVRPGQPPRVHVRPESPDRRRFLRRRHLPAESLQADRVGDFEGVNMGEHQRITR